jgi:hypothetical protein
MKKLVWIADAGKSTIGGQILYLSNMVDERTIQKYEREAKEKNRESWWVWLFNCHSCGLEQSFLNVPTVVGMNWSSVMKRYHLWNWIMQAVWRFIEKQSDQAC